MFQWLNLERVIIWVILGLFICYKRNWYEAYSNIEIEPTFACFMAIVFAPINFIVVFFKLFFLNKWEDKS